MEEENDNDFESREYQTELFELAIKKNLILYLPTGSGKTFIATLLIKHFGKIGDHFKKPIHEGGKRTFFLVNTVALVEQQAKHIETVTSFNVGQYSGDIGVDQWDKSVWLDEINQKKVLVMTAQIFLDLVLNHILSLKNTNLLIFDECHRAVSNHPMRQIMSAFEGVSVHDQPRILGLTATLLNGNVKSCDVESEIKTLEVTFMAQIATSVNEEMVILYSTNPKESKVQYNENDISSNCYKIMDIIVEECKVLLDTVMVEEPQVVGQEHRPINSYQIDKKDTKTNKRLKALLEDIRVNMQDLGIFGGSMAVLAHLVQIIQMLPNCQVDSAKRLYQIIITECILLRHKLCSEMHKENLSELQELKHFSSDKVNKLFAILKELLATDSAIIFVKRRFTAKILYYILKKASEIDPKLKNIKPNYVVGYNVSNPFKDTRENYLQRSQNKKVMTQFNQGLLNVLIASNVIEEGVDITQCNYVIMFDPLQDFRSYIQSKGRARDRSSKYIIMISRSDMKFGSKYLEFCQIESILKQILYGGKFKFRPSPTEEELNSSLFSKTRDLEPYRPKGNDGPAITGLSAISLINRYFASLQHDKFTKLSPVWWLQTNGSKVQSKCSLQLPMESKIRDLVEGKWQANKENAKRSAALEACKILHQHGELDDDTLLPVGFEGPDVNNINYTPNFDNSGEDFIEQVGDKTVTVGTKKNKRSCIKKWADCLCQCYPKPNKKMYLHVIEVIPVDSPPADNPRLVSFCDILSQPCSFAMLSSKKLPKLAPFPLYMSTGELEANVKDAVSITLSDNQLQLISFFHGVIFDKLLGVAKKFMIRNFKNTENSYLIAPVVQDSSHAFTIDWNVIEEAKGSFPSPESRPSNQERQTLQITDENYLGKVVSPWYRTVPAQKYVVTKVCFDMSENTEFPTNAISCYSTYRDYFKEKYKIEPLLNGQPLLEVRALSGRLNSIKPRSLTKQLKRKNKEENEDFEVWLIPEYCVLYPVAGKYWLKALVLPSALHRISQLCMSEELRCRLVRDTGVGLLHLDPGVKWDKLEQDISLQTKEILTEKQQALTPLNIFSKTSSSPKNDLKNDLQIWGKEEEPVDIERYMDSVTLFDILNYGIFIKKPLLGAALDQSVLKNNRVTLQKLTTVGSRAIVKMVKPPPLYMLRNTSAGIGPQQAHLMQALTAAAANDFVNCERLETLGDSFLKFAISLILFECQPDWTEGHLTYHKGKIVGNKNLYFCGKEKNLSSILEVQDFSPKEEWVPPGFCVEHSVQKVLRDAKLDPNCLFNVEIPNEEREKGELSSVTFERFNGILFEAEDAKQSQNWTILNLQALTNKNVSDIVEAILGTYLKACGLSGAMAVLKWFGVTNPDLATPQVFTSKTSSPAKREGDPNKHLLDPDYLEEILNYKFNDRSFLLQAVTHPSYTPNNITRCYQRLEFLGDAVIDFLITVHIFEKCQTLSPGDLTDLRSALVNNVTLSCITVRNQLHKFLLYNSSKLNECMMRFVKHQEDRNHVIDNDILFLFEEGDVNISESVDVPKSLGDIFEALVGAIYLDSGKNIEVTWKVVYNLMKNEIENFYKDIPKNHVRMLYESTCSPTFRSKPIQTDGAVMMTVEIIHKGVVKCFNGFGDNKHQAKRAAAKHALRAIRTP